MDCPYCGRDMDRGYITSDAPAIAWRKEKYGSAVVRKGDGVQLYRSSFGGAGVIANAFRCRVCRKIIIDYSEEGSQA